MQLSKAEPDDVLRHRHLIENIADRINEPDLFPRIHEALLSRRAFLFQSDDVFTVLKPTPDYMLVWVLGSHTGKSSARRQHDYLKDVEKLARIGGARFIRIWTVRRGFARILTGYAESTVTHNGKTFAVWEKML